MPFKFFKQFALVIILGASLATVTPAWAVLTPGPGLTIVPLPGYIASVSGPTDTDGMFNQTFLGFDGSGAASFQLTSLTSVGDYVTLRAQFLIDEDAARWDVAGAGAHRSRLFLEAGVGAPLAAPLPGGAQRDDMNQTPGVTMEYNTLGLNDNTNWDYVLDNVNQIAAGDFVLGDTNTADLDQNNGAAADTPVAGGYATLATTISRTGVNTFDWFSQVQYHYVDGPPTDIAIAGRTGSLTLPGPVANTYFTPFAQLGIGDTTGPWSEDIIGSVLIFNIAPLVPEPATLGLAGFAAFGLIAAGRRRRRGC